MTGKTYRGQWIAAAAVLREHAAEFEKMAMTAPEEPVTTVISGQVTTFELPVCRDCISLHLRVSTLPVAYDDQPRVCAFCAELRQPLYAVSVVKPAENSHTGRP